MSLWTEKDRRLEDAARAPADVRGSGGGDPDDPSRRDDARGEAVRREAVGKDDGPSKDDLYEEAKRLRIEGRSRMTREELLAAIRVATAARKPR